MQRIRVGLTGLGAVLLIVAVSAAIFESASNQPAPVAGDAANQSERTVANMMVNSVEAPTEPLAEIGLTPGAPPTPTDNSATPAAR